jgi:hypothetical protein
MQVQEILATGHRDFRPEQLRYVKDMANRVGFSVLDATPGLGRDTFRIELKISMSDPIFIARLRKG